MELVKVNESVNRTFNGEVATEEVTSVTYDVVENGANIGSASISDGYFSVSAQMPGVSASEIKSKVKAMFAAE